MRDPLGCLDPQMTHLDSQLVHGRRLLAIFISPGDPEDQYAITGIARWDGAALWLQSDQSGESLLLTKPGGRLILSELTAAVRVALAQGSEHEAVLAPLASNADCLAVARLDRLPAGAIAVPRTISQAIVPDWQAK